MTPVSSLAELDKLRQEILAKRDPNKPCLTVCSGTACHSVGCDKIADAFVDEINRLDLGENVDIRRTGCHGFCERGPIVIIYPEAICYLEVKVKDVPEIVSKTIVNKKIVDRLLYVDSVTKQKIVKESEIPFYKNQTRIIFGNNTKIDPNNIEDYIALGGYTSIKALFNMSPEQIIDEVKKSGLRGRGGAGFPTGLKWEFCRKAKGDTKYIICNADEGDPGAYMDRSLLEGNPHSVLEGMIIGAYAIGAHEGYVYVRYEYPLTVKNLRIAIKQAEEYGFLGKNILGSGFDFTVKINRGGGAFVCGEETGLIASLEGKSGEPSAKYIYPAEKGLWEQPTIINNVETWANIPLIISNGANWFAKMGTANSKGTKIFSLVGKINNTGLVEVPMGITVRDIIYKIGGGIPKGKKFKAVQTGGPSGGAIPAEHLDSIVDFDELTKIGSMMGSGGMIVMDENTCMVDMAKYFVNFLSDESCGKCLPCREGLKQMLEILTDITEGRGKEEDIELLEDIAAVMVDTSLCALGTTAANPVLSTIRYFRDEYEAHIKEKRCPAGVCKELISYYIDPSKCKGCLICLRNCPVDAIIGGKNQIHVIDQGKCTKCGTCLDVCPPRFNAIRTISGEPVPPPLPEKERVLVRQRK